MSNRYNYVIGDVQGCFEALKALLKEIRFDPDQDVIEIQFRQAPYATRFRVMNREATSAQNTEETPWYKRALLWKVIVIVLFIMFMARLMK